MAQSPAEKLVSLKPKGRTIEQMANDLGMSIERTKTLLEKPALPQGYHLVRWKSHLGGQYFEVLPPDTHPPQPRPRDFRFLRAPKPDSYIRIFIPDDILDVNGKKAKFIEIFPFSDVHWGHRQCDKKNFLLDVKEVAKRPNRFAILNGDNIENALGDSAGGAAWAEQSANPKVQRDQTELIYRRIAHKCLAATPGNHEARTTKKTLMNPLEEVCKGLDIPYFEGPYNMEIIWRGYRWTFFIKHGTGNSNTPGGKLNNAGRDRGYNDFRNFYCSGHVHDEMSHKVPRRVRHREFENEKLKRFWIENLKEYKVIFPSYLLYSGTYAEEAGYSPGSRNTIALQLFANGDYHVVSSKRRKNGGGDEKNAAEEEII